MVLYSDVRNKLVSLWGSSTRKIGGFYNTPQTILIFSSGALALLLAPLALAAPGGGAANSNELSAEVSKSAGSLNIQADSSIDGRVDIDADVKQNTTSNNSQTNSAKSNLDAEVTINGQTVQIPSENGSTEQTITGSNGNRTKVHINVQNDGSDIPTDNDGSSRIRIRSDTDLDFRSFSN